MKNICFFNTIKKWGGGEKWHFEMALFLASKNFNVHFITSKNSVLSNKLKGSIIKTYFIDVKNFSFLNIIKVNKTTKYLEENNIEIVIINSSQDMKFGGLASKKAGVKHIIYRRGSAIPIKKSFINRYFFSNVITGIIANSEATKKTINTNYKLFDSRKIFVLRNGIDTQSYLKDLQQVKEKKRHSKIILGNLGRLVHQKNQLFLIDVAFELKKQNIPFQLIIGGEGRLKEKLVNKIKSLHLEKEIILEGFVDTPSLFFNKIDIFLLSSLWEGFGYVIAEAMLFKKPVIAFNSSSNPELVTANKNGFLCKPNDLNDFTKKTVRLIKDKDIRRKMGDFGFKKIIEEYDSHIIREKFINYINQL